MAKKAQLKDKTGATISPIVSSLTTIRPSGQVVEDALNVLDSTFVNIDQIQTALVEKADIGHTHSDLDDRINIVEAAQLQHFTLRRVEKFNFTEVPISTNGGFINLLSLFTFPTDLTIDDGLNWVYTGTGDTVAVKFPYLPSMLNNYVKVEVNIRISGRSSDSSSFKDWTWKIVRANNNETVETGQGFKGGSSYFSANIDRTSINLMSWTRGADDPFIINGVRIELQNPTNATMYLTGCQITTKLLW